MKTQLYNRRRRMLTLMSLNNSFPAIVDALCAEFKCKPKAIYSDKGRMSTWVKDVQQQEELGAIYKARYDYLLREGLELMQGIDNKTASVKDKFVKIGALNCCSKITSDEIKLALEQGKIQRQPIEIMESSLDMPFTINPDIKKALEESAEEQRIQKELKDKKRLEDAKVKQAQADAGV